ncbi:MAG: two-component sensor histidine kinase [Proteobacteria bacterium]|nr:two-component sensor histidine kinase [Pseudomonadota bacterium]
MSQENKAGPNHSKASDLTKSYRLLSRKMVLAVVLVSFIPLLITGGIILSRFSSAFQKIVKLHLEVLVQKHGNDINRFLTNRLGDIRVMARSTTPEDLAEPVQAPLESGLINQKLALLKEEYGGVYVDLGLVDYWGTQVAYAGPFNLLRANYAESDWFKKTIKSEHFISDVFTGLRGSPHFIIAVKQAWLGQDWILRATIDFDYFNSLVENIQVGRTGFAFILNRRGEFQTKPRFEVALNQSPYQDFINGRLDPKRTSISMTTDATGREAIVAMAPLKGGEWVLCCQQQAADAYTDLRNAQLLALAAILLSGLVIVAVAFLIARRMIERLSMADTEKADMNEKVIEAGRLASIGELAAGIAHEINNPVAIMVEEAGWIEDLLGDEDVESSENLTEIQRSVTQIKTQGARCKEITHKLLSFARKTDPLIREVQLNDVVGDVVSLLKQKTRYVNVNIDTDLVTDLPNIAASPSELQQVLLNLVNNAVDAIGSSGGTVRLTTREEGGMAVFRVSDDGPGIPEAIMARIFDPFFTTKPVGQGTGLGLSICYGIVNKLNGRIEVESVVGQGTVFTVRLPEAKGVSGQDSGPNIGSC